MFERLTAAWINGKKKVMARNNDKYKKEIEECKKEGMPDFMIEQHILDLLEEESEEEG